MLVFGMIERYRSSQTNPESSPRWFVRLGIYSRCRHLWRGSWWLGSWMENMSVRLCDKRADVVAAAAAWVREGGVPQRLR